MEHDPDHGPAADGATAARRARRAVPAGQRAMRPKAGRAPTVQAVPDMLAGQLPLRPGQSVELLKELHILTPEGRLNQDSRRKLKQVYHLIQFMEPVLGERAAQGAGLTLADHGAGKSYLGFILYDLCIEALGQGHIYGIETRAELVQRSEEHTSELQSP